jgi:hypothetical protein
VLVGLLLLSFDLPALVGGSPDSRVLTAVDFFTGRKRQAGRAAVDLEAVHRWFGELGRAILRLPIRHRLSRTPSVFAIRPLMIRMTGSIARIPWRSVRRQSLARGVG